MTEHTYRLFKHSWGIVITIQGEFTSTTNITDAVKVTDGIWLKIDTKWKLYESQIERLKQGLLFVAADIKKATNKELVLVTVTELLYNPTDYQEEGLVVAVVEWAAQACGFTKPHISVTFDRHKRQYEFNYMCHGEPSCIGTM